MSGFGNFRMLAVAAFLAGAVALPTAAATVTYQSDEADPKVQLVIDDTVAGAGKFRFTLTTVSGAADFLGLGFDIAGISLKKSTLSLVSFTSTHSAPNTPTLVLYGKNTNSQTACGKGCNFNGGGTWPEPFDYIVRIGENGGGKKNVSGIVFDVTTAGSLADNPFSGFGVRAQGTTGPSNSIKFRLVETASSVPLPAAGWLLLAGLGRAAPPPSQDLKDGL
jgi:hypothetical protein